MNEDARKRALKILEKRDVSRKMMVDRLTEKGTSEADAAEVADWLCDVGAISDERFAELVARHYARKGYGEQRIREELYRRGIPRDLWDAAMSELPETDDAAYRLLSRKLEGTSCAPEDLRRAQDHLLRRGYSWEEIRAALERFQAESEE